MLDGIQLMFADGLLSGDGPVYRVLVLPVEQS